MHSTILSSKLALVTLISTLTNAIPIQERHLFKRAPLSLGLAKSFGALAYSTLTSTGATSITGDIGVFPGWEITGFTPGEHSGTASLAGVAAQNGEESCLTAYNAGWALKATAKALPSADLGGVTLSPGAYTFPASAVGLTGTLTLSGLGNSSGQFIFLVETSFVSAAAAKIVLKDGASACNVYSCLGRRPRLVRRVR